MSRYEDVDVKDTLASQLDCKNTYARWYANMLLSKVQCVDDVTQLRNYATATVSYTHLDVYKRQ